MFKKILTIVLLMTIIISTGFSSEDVNAGTLRGVEAHPEYGFLTDPRNPSVTITKKGQVKITWDAQCYSGSKIVFNGFQVYRKTDDSKWVKIGVVKPDKKNTSTDFVQYKYVDKTINVDEIAEGTVSYKVVTRGKYAKWNSKIDDYTWYKASFPTDYICKITLEKLNVSPTEEEVSQKLAAFRKKYPEGAWWGNGWEDNSIHHYWPKEKARIIDGINLPLQAGGCTSFATMASDYVFGTDTPLYKLTTMDRICVGDILVMKEGPYAGKGGHYVVILSVNKGENTAIVAEGNWSSRVHWDHKIDLSICNFDFLLTRILPDEHAGQREYSISTVMLGQPKVIESGWRKAPTATTETTD